MTSYCLESNNKTLVFCLDERSLKDRDDELKLYWYHKDKEFMDMTINGIWELLSWITSKL